MKKGLNLVKICLLVAVLATLGVGIGGSADAAEGEICFCTSSPQVCCVVDGVSVIGKKHETEIESE